jgi:hypothetical protein
MAEPVAPSPWHALGIAPTSDRQAIRRAYAARLKAIDREHDIQAFLRLRAAFEAAMRGTALHSVELPPIGQSQAPEATEPDALSAIRERLRQGDPAKAWSLFQKADLADALPLTAIGELEEDLLALAAPMRTLPPETLAALVRRFRWDEAVHKLRAAKPALFAQLDRRLDAERWHADLVGHAAAPKRLWPDRRRFVARLLLRGPPRWYEWGFTLADLRLLLGTPRQALMQALQHYERHEEWLGERFAARRIRWCRGRIKPIPVLAIYIMGFGCIAPIIGFTQNHEIAVPLIVLAINFFTFMITWAIIRLSAQWARLSVQPARRWWRGS